MLVSSLFFKVEKFRPNTTVASSLKRSSENDSRVPVKKSVYIVVNAPSRLTSKTVALLTVSYRERLVQ